MKEVCTEEERKEEKNEISYLSQSNFILFLTVIGSIIELMRIIIFKDKISRITNILKTKTHLSTNPDDVRSPS